MKNVHDRNMLRNALRSQFEHLPTRIVFDNNKYKDESPEERSNLS